MKIKRFRNRYNKLSTRLIATITLAVVICFSIFTFNVSASIAESELQQFEKNTEMLTRYIDHEMQGLVEEINSANGYYEVSLMTATSLAEERENISDSLNTYKDFTNGLFLIKSPEKNNIVEYYKLNSTNTLNVKTPEFNTEEILRQYKAMSIYSTQFFYFDKDTHQLFTIKKLYQTASQKEILLGIEINNSVLSQYFSDNNQNDLGNIGITDEDGTILFHVNDSLIGKSINDLSIGNEIAENIASAISSKEKFQQKVGSRLDEIELVESQNHTFMYFPVPINTYDTTWGIIVDMNDNDLKESSLKIAGTIIFGGLFTLIILVILIKLIVNRGLKPIDSIMAVMKDVENGNLNSRTSIASCNEMEIIGSQLNDLLDHMIDDRESIVNQKNEIEDLLIEVENLMQENDRIYYETIKSLAKTIDAKDPYTGGHCDRVTEYSLFIGKEMALSSEELSSLTYGAMLHDIGKIGISESIITKEGRLTDEEFDSIKTHPEKGFEILKDIHFLKDARLGVLHHHERYDGRGYPHGLKGSETDLKARIIAIADAFDAMTSDRSYRKALTIDKAIEQLVNNKGLQFDPDMVDLLVEGVHSGRITV